MTKCISLGKLTFILVQGLQITCGSSLVGCLESWLCFNQLKILAKYYLPSFQFLLFDCHKIETKKDVGNFFHYIGITGLKFILLISVNL